MVGLVLMFTWPGLVWAVVSAGLTCSRDGFILGSTSCMARPAVRLLPQLLTSFWVVLSSELCRYTR